MKKTLVYCLPVLLFALLNIGCGSSSDDVLEQIESNLKVDVSGKVSDQGAKALEGATVKLFKISSYIDSPSELKKITSSVGYPEAKLVIDIEKLLKTTPAATVTSDAEGKYVFEKQTADLFIIYAEKENYAPDLLGIDFETGEINQDNVIKPADIKNPKNIENQDLVLYGSEMEDTELPEPEPAPEPVIQPECLTNADCFDQNMICVENECKFECEADEACAEGLHCIDNHCIVCAQDADCGDASLACVNGACVAKGCTADAECTEAGFAKCDNGACVPACDVWQNTGCADPTPVCKPEGNGAACKPECESNAECPTDYTCEENKCVAPPDPNIVEDPKEPPAWTVFKIYTEDGATVMADASTGAATLDVANLGDSRVIRIVGEHSDTSITSAFLRVQVGSYDCGEELPPKVDYIPITLNNGKIVSELGEFQRVAVYPDVFNALQLDLDEDGFNGTESFSVSTNVNECKAPENPVQIILTWEEASTDLDLHVWHVAETGEESHVFFAKKQVAGAGYLDVDDRDGFGPEIFTADKDVSGLLRIRVHYFTGSVAPVKGSVRIIQYKDGKLSDNTYPFEAATRRDWVDIGELPL